MEDKILDLSTQANTHQEVINGYKKELIDMVREAVLEIAKENGAQQAFQDYCSTRKNLQNFNDTIKALLQTRSSISNNYGLSYRFYAYKNSWKRWLDWRKDKALRPIVISRSKGEEESRKYIDNKKKELTTSVNEDFLSTIFFKAIEKTKDPKKQLNIWLYSFRKEYIKESILDALKRFISKNYRDEINLLLLYFFWPDTWKRVRKYKENLKKEVKRQKERLMTGIPGKLGLLPSLSKENVSLEDCISKTRLLKHLDLIPSKNEDKKNSLLEFIKTEREDLENIKNEIEVLETTGKGIEPLHKESEIEKVEDKIVKEICDKCGHEEIVLVYVKITDFAGCIQYQYICHQEYLLDGLGISEAGDIDFRYCLNCGKIQGEFPRPFPNRF